MNKTCPRCHGHHVNTRRTPYGRVSSCIDCGAEWDAATVSPIEIGVIVVLIAVGLAAAWQLFGAVFS